jgi:deoxyribonuclease-1/deoxyribonuclease-1-like protein
MKIKKRIVEENNKRKITVTNDYVYNDVLGVYERPPYVAKFQISESTVSIRDFYVLNVHLRPQNVFLESLDLRNVVDEILLEDSNHNIAVLGDFNFDCDYISGKLAKET